VPDGGDHPLEALCGPGSSWRAGALVRFGPGGPLACSDRDVGLLAAFPAGIARSPSRAGSYYLVDNGCLEILEVKVDGSAALCPPAGLRCTAGAGSVELVWTPGPYTVVDVLRDGVEVAALDGSAARWEDPVPPAGREVLYEVAGRSGDLRSCPAACAVTPPQVIRPALPISDTAGISMADAPDIPFSAIGAGGAPLTFAAGDGDDGSVEVDIGFPFPFFGSLQSNVTVGVNGLLVFGGAARQPANTDIPSPRLPDGLIAPFWDDLDASALPSAVLTRLAGTSPGRTFTIEWSHLQFFPADADEPNGDLSFQAVLHESGQVDLVWGDLRGPEADLACGASATVGMEAPGAASGIRYSLGTCAIAARSAVRILPSGTVLSPRFLRGDANADGSVDISDPVAILFQLFSASPAIPCLEAADANDDGTLDISDPIYLLTFLFLDGPAPVLPFDPLGDPARCGPDPVPHAGPPLGCESFAPCGTVGKDP